MSVEFKHVEVEQEGPASEEEERIDLTMPDASTYATLDGELQKVLNSIEQLDWRLQDIDRGDKKVTPPTAEEIGELYSYVTGLGFDAEDLADTHRRFLKYLRHLDLLRLDAKAQAARAAAA